jgi:basic membrane protein A
MRTKTVALLVIGSLVASIFLLAGCQPTPAPTEAPEPTSPPPTEVPTEEPAEEPSGPVEPLDVAFLCTGVVDDQSWNQWIYEGLSRLQTEGQINLSVSEEVDIPDYGRIATEYAEEGYDLILGNTPEMQEASLAVSEEYPDSHFAVVGAWMLGDNHASMLIHQTQGAYLAGLVAGSMTQTDSLAAVGCFDVPTQIASHEGFKLGIAQVNPDAEVQDVWTGTWYDVNIGYEAAQALIESGVDVIMISCSGPGFGVLEAAKDTGPEVMVVGAFVDMQEVAPENVMTSVVWDSYAATLEMLENIRAGTFEGREYWGTVANGGIGLSPYWGFESQIPEDVKTLVRDATEQIRDGTLDIPWIGEVPEE